MSAICCPLVPADRHTANAASATFVGAAVPSGPACADDNRDACTLGVGTGCIGARGISAATAAIGVQEAQLYPTLRLDGSVSAATVNTVTLGPTLILPLLTRGVRLARRDAARANAVEAEATWRKTVLSAVEEVQTALVRLQQADQQVAALRRAVITYRDTRRLSQEAFELNAVTVLDVLDTEDSLTSTELNLAAARRSFAQSWAQLNVGIGQGWMAEKPLVETVAVAKTTTVGG